MNQNPTDSIQKSAKLVDSCLAHDRTFIGFEKLDLQSKILSEPIFAPKQVVDLPAPLFDQYEKLEYKCFMGLFPEIHRAWVTIDNKFFIWSYLNGTDFNEYDELDQVIVSAGLVRPKPGIFKEYVKYLLVLATPVEVVLVAVTISNIGGHEELNLLPTNYSISSDCVNMLKIAGTKNGRIFMCGQDGNLYELTYEADEGWLRKKCRKLNHSQSFIGLLVPSFLKFSTESPIIDIAIDDERNTLYTLSENSTIEVYHLDNIFGTTMKTISYSSLAKDLKRDIAPKIIAIAPITEKESKNLHLTAISSKGERFFFNISFKRLNLRIVRSTSSELPNVHECFYNKGVFIMADTKGDDSDNLIFITYEKRYAHNRFIRYMPTSLAEIISSRDFNGRRLSADGRIHAMAEIPINVDRVLVPEEDFLSDLSTQHVAPPREFVCLSNNGIHLFTKLRPVERLYQILQLQATNDQNALNQLRAFFDDYGDDEACCMCLILACNPEQQFEIERDSVTRQISSNISNLTIIKRAIETFFERGGEPRMEESKTLFGSVQGMGGPISQPDIAYSASHNGLYLYFSRLIRPLWNHNMFAVKLNDKNEVIDVIERFQIDHLQLIKQLLQRLDKFLQENPKLYSAIDTMVPKRKPQSMIYGEYNRENKTVTGGLPQLINQQPQRLQQKSILSLFEIIKRSIEGVAFLQFLMESNVASYLKEMKEDIKLVSRFTFRDLILRAEGEKVMKDLARLAVVKTDNVDYVLDKLRDFSIFFNSNDLREYHAFYKLRLVQSVTRDNQLRERLLHEALQEYLQIAAHINIPDICKVFQRMKFYTGAVELALVGAERIDPSNQALNYFKGGKPQYDTQGLSLYEKKLKCYDCALSVLEELTNQLASSQYGTAISSSERSQILEKMKKSTDELFHYHLYSWYLRRPELLRELFEFRTKYLESFLIKKAPRYLSQYYLVNRKYYEAAKVLLELADTPTNVETSTLDDLQKRIDYLSEAIAAANASPVASDLLHTLRAKLDVAHLQMAVCKELETNITSQEANRALHELYSRLMNITELYNNYACRFNLLESCLRILYVSGYKDSKVIKDLWARLIEKYLDNDLDTKIKDLAESFQLDLDFVPVDFICSELQKHNFNALDFIRHLKDVKTPYENIYNAYRRLYEKLGHTYEAGSRFEFPLDRNVPKVSPQTDYKIKLELLTQISEILLNWIKDAKQHAVSAAKFSADMIKQHIDTEYNTELNRYRELDVDRIRKNLEEAKKKA
jgi:nuclear pore complex protein Nup155